MPGEANQYIQNMNQIKSLFKGKEQTFLSYDNLSLIREHAVVKLVVKQIHL